jgi:hypothetical protein
MHIRNYMRSKKGYYIFVVPKFLKIITSNIEHVKLHVGYYI